MDVAVGLLVVLAIGYGVYWFLRHRGKKRSDRRARADKRARSDEADARAIKRSLDGRR